MGNCTSDSNSGGYEDIRVHRAQSGQTIPLHLVEETRPVVTKQPRSATTSFITVSGQGEDMSLHAVPGGAAVEIVPPPGMLAAMEVEVISSGTWVMATGETEVSSLRTLTSDPGVRPHLLSVQGARSDRLSRGMKITFRSSPDACDSFRSLVGALYTGYMHNQEVRYVAILEW